MHPESEHRKDKREATFRDRKNILEIAFQNLEKAYNCKKKRGSKMAVVSTELEFLKSLWGLGTEEEYRTGPPGYKGWRNSFLGTNSGAP